VVFINFKDEEIMKHWVFDLDGTLVDSFNHYFIALDEIFTAHGKKFSPKYHHAVLTQPLQQFFEKHLGEKSVKSAFELLQSTSNRDAKTIRPFTGLTETLTHLKSKGARMAVWTNRDLVSAKLMLKHSGLDQFTEICVSGTCVKERKPNPEGLLRIMKEFGCKSDTVTMVGDHEHDVSAAKSVGVRAVRASWHGYWKMDRCSYADHQFHRTEEFSTWVKGF